MPIEKSTSNHSNSAYGTINNHSVTFSKDFTYLPILPIILENGNTSIQTDALLDSGLDFTLIDPKMVHQLKLKTSFKENLCNSDDLMSGLVNFEISSVVNNKSRKVNAYTVNQLNVPDNKITFLVLKNNFCISVISAFLPSETQMSPCLLEQIMKIF